MREARTGGLAAVVAFTVALVGAASAGAAQAPAGSVDVRRDVRYGTAGDTPLVLDAYVPGHGGDRRPAVVLLHGGGWRVGDKATFAEEAVRLAAMGWVAFSVNYRLAEPAAFPAEVDDVRAAVRWVRSNAVEYGVDPARIGALGESAGGHLAALLATLGDGDLATDARIRVAAAWSGPMDLSALARSRGAGWSSRLLPCPPDACADRWAQVSPTTHVDGSDAPLLLVHSTDELVPLSQAQAMSGRLGAAGVDHRLYVLPGTRHALDYRADAWQPTVDFLSQFLAERPPESPMAQGTRSSGAPWTAVLAGVVALVGGVAVVTAMRRSTRPGP